VVIISGAVNIVALSTIIPEHERGCNIVRNRPKAHGQRRYSSANRPDVSLSAAIPASERLGRSNVAGALNPQLFVDAKPPMLVATPPIL
jgi:hypothetical protein